MSKTITIEQFKYEISNGPINGQDTTVELKYRELANQAITSYNTQVSEINKRYSEDKKINNEAIDTLLSKLNYIYTLNTKIVDNVTHYAISRETIEFADITEEQSNNFRILKAMESVNYIGFKIVNNVFITSRELPGNHVFFINGEVLTDDEIKCLEIGDIPKRLIETKPIW